MRPSRLTGHTAAEPPTRAGRPPSPGSACSGAAGHRPAPRRRVRPGPLPCSTTRPAGCPLAPSAQVDGGSYAGG
eukprot:518158-Alexandrium_andersonii.AAC.1